MAPIDFDKLPRFADLPVKDGVPPDSAWGVFGDDDELGCVNLLTAEGVVKHTIFPLPDETLAHDDQLDNYNTQEGAQWDGFGHGGHPVHGLFYNGVKPEEIKPGPDGKIGIHLWGDKMVGRAVLLDVF